MNIKSLLLGSAAALVAVTGARAADAVVIAEPEPMDYVRICDVYGTGFYYIPGTETCLKIGGYVRFDVRGGDFDAVAETDVLDFSDGDTQDTYNIRSRLALRLDARTETELGTLRSFGQIEFNYDTGETPVNVNGVIFDASNAPGTTTSLNQAYIELGGFRLGKTDSLFTTWTGYAGSVILDDVNVAYGPFDTHQIAYTFTGANGFSAAVAVEDGGDGPGRQIDSYIPDVVGGVSYTQGWGGISVVAGFDSVTEEGAIKGRLDVNATDAISLFVMAGWSTNDAPGLAANNQYARWAGDFMIFGGGSFKVSEKAKINAQVAYDDGENFSAGINVDYELVPGFTITPELVYVDNFDIDDADGFGALVRFQRNF